MIGVFDSGLGGLTIFRAVTAALPQYDYLYLADTAHAPYGNRTAAEIADLTWAGVSHLFDQGCHLVILGCNTASTVLRELQQERLPQQFPDRRLLGIIVPTIEQITGTAWRHEQPISTPLEQHGFVVGVLATPATVAAGVFVNEVGKRNASIRVVQQACPELVGLIESGASRQQLQEAVTGYVELLLAQTTGQQLAAVLLGCTHYELIADLITQALPAKTELYHQPSIVADSLAEYLNKHTELETQLGQKGTRTYLTTGDAVEVSEQAIRFFPGSKLEFSRVKI